MDKTKLMTYDSSLNSNLVYYLGKFEKNQQWADIAPLLLKIEGLLKQNPSPFIQEKIQLAKRLAQCLNPHLSAPLHQSVLRIYDQLFKNMVNFKYNTDQPVTKLIVDDMVLFSIGLFPFFQNSSSKIRPQFLDIIKNHYVPLKRELIPLIPGIVARQDNINHSILPGLDDQQELIQKQTLQVLDDLAGAVGRKYLLGAIWMVMLRSPKCRSASLKYLSQRIQKMEGDEEEDDKYLSDNSYEDENKAQPVDTVQDNNQVEVQEESQQDQGDAQVIQEIESETKRKNDLLSLEEHIDDDIFDNNFPVIHIQSLIAALDDEKYLYLLYNSQLIKRQVLDFLYSHLKSVKIDGLSKELLVQSVIKLLIRKDLSVTRRVNQWLFGKPDMDNKYQINENNKEILHYISQAFNYYFEQPATEQNVIFPIKLLQNFFMEHDHMVEMILDKISIKLILYVKNNKHHSELIKSCKRLLESITSYLLLTINEVTKEFDPLINFIFNYLITKEDNYEPQIEFTLLHMAAANLFNSISQLSIEQIKQQDPGPVILQILNRMQSLPNKIDASLVRPDSIEFDKSIELYGQFYEQIADAILDGNQDEQLLKQFENLGKSLVKGQKFKVQKLVKQLPNWFTSITKIIKEENPQVSLIAIECMIEILVSQNLDQIYENLRKLIVEESRTKLQKDQLIEGLDYTKLTLEKLWNLLDYPYFHDKIIQMIVNLSKVFPLFFTEVVIYQFQHMQEAAIRRFAVFWKLSAQYYKELQELNKVGLFLMLDFLDHPNPIIRHNAKNWLLESTGMLERILDPLFEVLIQSSSVWYITDRKQIFFAKVYETRRINETIKKLKSILVSFSNQFMDYVSNQEISQYIKDIRMHFTNEGSVVMERQNMMYLDLLVIICLKYVQGQAIESMSPKFYRENAAVNASACEYIELLVTNVEDPMVSLRFAEYIMEPLQIVLYHSIENEDLVMQVQLLNLFKVIFFNSAFRTRHKQEQRDLIEDTMSRTVSNDIFIPTLIRGMHTNVLYVRAQYIQFISTCIPLLAEHLRPSTLTDCVQQVLAAYFKMISNIANRKYNKENSQQKMNQFDYLQGSSQHEIQTILIGVKTILKHILGLQERDDMVVVKQIEKNSVLDSVASVFSFGLLNIQDNMKQKNTFQKFQQTCEVIVSTLPQILELYINCWELSQDFLKYSEQLTIMGISSYSFEKFNSYNKILQDNKENQLKDTNIVKPQILFMMKPLFITYGKDFMTALMTVWQQQCQSLSKLIFEYPQKLIDPLHLNQNVFLQKTIELLVMIQCPFDLFLESLIECQQLVDIQRFYDVQRRKKLQTPILNYQISQQETIILFFIYCYFSYIYIDSAQLKKDILLSFWTQMMKLLNLFSQSKAPSTSLWLIEIQLLLTRKYSPKEILVDQKFRNMHHEFINEKLKFIGQISSKQFSCFWNDPQDKIEGLEPFALYNSRYKIILPLNPALFDNYMALVQFFKNENPSFTITDIDKQIYGSLGNYVEEELYGKYRLMSIRTLKTVALELLQNSYAVEKQDRVILRCKEFMDLLFPILENRNQNNQIFVQCVTELLYTILEKAKQLLLKTFKHSILDLFNREDFFIQKQVTLQYWAKIINWVVSADQKDLFQEYLEQVSLQSSFFSNESDENKKRIMSFERICFVIFSGERDKYTKKLQNLIEKISEVIKNTESVHPGLLILILFCVRVLILRLSPIQLNELFRNMWPTLLTLLISIFRKPQSSINLILAALKLIEMISLMQQEEFYFHQWIFIYDYFGLQVDNNPQTQSTQFSFQPLFSNYIDRKLNVDYKNLLKVDATTAKREIIIKLIKVDSKEQLAEIAQNLLTYLIKLNSQRTVTNAQDIEELIENDFIQLDVFIYKEP